MGFPLRFHIHRNTQRFGYGHSAIHLTWGNGLWPRPLFAAVHTPADPSGYPTRLTFSFLGGAGTMFILRDRYVNGVRRPWHLRGFTIGLRGRDPRKGIRSDRRVSARLYITRNANRYI